MKQSTSLEKLVMKRVEEFEKIRTRNWVLKFIIACIVVVLLTGLIMVFIGYDLWQKQIFEISYIFMEDFEIFMEYGIDAIKSMLEEMPLFLLLTLGIIVMLVITFTVLTQKKRQIILKRLYELEKIKDKS